MANIEIGERKPTVRLSKDPFSDEYEPPAGAFQVSQGLAD